MSDRTLLYGAAFVRAVATGLVGVLLGIHLAELALPAAQIGLVIGAGLTGAAAAALLATFRADQLGRRPFLVGLALLGAAGAAAFALASNPVVLGIAAFAGMMNGMGRDRGAALILEQAVLPSTTTDADRTRAFAVYNVIQDVGHAIGSLLIVCTTLFERLGADGPVSPLRMTFGVYAVLTLAVVPLYMRLSGAVEVHAAARTARVSPESRSVLWRISSLFALDSLAGGLLTTALLSFFFHERFGASPAAIGALFFGARLANALSHFGAAWLAKRIGLVNTMVFTHIPSSLLMITVAIAPNFPVAAILFLIREGLVEMDVPTRQSYVMAVVRPEERTYASGLTNVVRVAAWAVAPAFAGLFMERFSMLTPLVVGSLMKVAYDLLLYNAFRHRRPPEEILA